MIVNKAVQNKKRRTEPIREPPIHVRTESNLSADIRR